MFDIMFLANKCMISVESQILSACEIACKTSFRAFTGQLMHAGPQRTDLRQVFADDRPSRSALLHALTYILQR